MFAGAVIFATAPTFGLLLAGRLLFGVGGLVVNLMLARLLTAAFAGRELALAMGVFMATYPASMITVFSLHPVLIERIGWRNELLLLAALVGLAIPLFLVAVGRPGSSDITTEHRRVSFRVTPPLAALALTWMLFFAVHSSVLTFAPEWAGGGAAALLIVTIVMWVAMIGSPLVGTLIDRTSVPTRWVAVGLAVQGTALACAASGILSPIPAMLGVGLATALVPTASTPCPVSSSRPKGSVSPSGSSRCARTSAPLSARPPSAPSSTVRRRGRWCGACWPGSRSSPQWYRPE